MLEFSDSLNRRPCHRTHRQGMMQSVRTAGLGRKWGVPLKCVRHAVGVRALRKHVGTATAAQHRELHRIHHTQPS